MKEMVFIRCFVLAMLLAFVGCGSESEVVEAPPSYVSMMKSGLDGVVQTGQLGSGMMMVTDGLHDMEGEDPAKAEKLTKEVEELKAMSDANARKVKAQAIIDQL